MKNAIRIPEHMRLTQPHCAEFCDVVNDALRETPGMTLAEFARLIDYANVEGERQRLRKIIQRQLNQL